MTEKFNVLRTLFVTTLWLNFNFLVVNAQYQCVMYGQCALWNDFVGIPCVDHGPPKLLDDFSLDRLTSLCPELVSEYGEYLCCSREQIDDLQLNMGLAQHLLAKCPSCWYNFRQNFCHMTCSPVQYRFLNVSETILNEEGVPMVSKLDFFVQDSYVQGTYDSCKNVHLASTGDPVMLFFCGLWGSVNCTAHRWFDSMGSIENGFSPFDIRFNYFEEGVTAAVVNDFVPFDFEHIGCDESADDNTCACIDCPSVCVDEKKCVMFDKCDAATGVAMTPQNYPQNLNCQYDGPPHLYNKNYEDKDLPESHHQMLMELCPELILEAGLEFCCSVAQISELSHVMTFLMMNLRRSEPCFQNLRQLFCALTCSPYQHLFLRVNETIESSTVGKAAVSSLDFYAADYYVKCTHESCLEILRDVVEESVSQSTLLCNSNGFELAACAEAHKWFDFMGTPLGFYGSPGNVTFHYATHFAPQDDYDELSRMEVAQEEMPEGIIPFNASLAQTCIGAA